MNAAFVVIFMNLLRGTTESKLWWAPFLKIRWQIGVVWRAVCLKSSLVIPVLLTSFSGLRKTRITVRGLIALYLVRKIPQLLVSRLPVPLPLRARTVRNSSFKFQGSGLGKVDFTCSIR